MSEMTMKGWPEEAQETWRVVRLLWSSNRDDPKDYYADKLELLRDGDGRLALRLNVGGHVTVQEVKNIIDYV